MILFDVCVCIVCVCMVCVCVCVCVYCVCVCVCVSVCFQAIDSFLEELVVRRELADNFCFYQPQYDSLDGAWNWAQTTLNDHRNDKREFVYT